MTPSAIPGVPNACRHSFSTLLEEEIEDCSSSSSVQKLSSNRARLRKKRVDTASPAKSTKYLIIIIKNLPLHHTPASSHSPLMLDAPQSSDFLTLAVDQLLVHSAQNTDAPPKQIPDLLTLTATELLGQLHDAEQTLDKSLDDVMHSRFHESLSEHCTFGEKEDQEQVLHKLFKKIDTNSNGKLSREEIMANLGSSNKKK